MEKVIVRSFVSAIITVLSFFVLQGPAFAYEKITAYEAYEMYLAGEADILDVRSLEELHWVGSPALEPGGDPISYVIPLRYFLVTKNGATSELNPDFLDSVKAIFSYDHALILFCRSGGRSSAAAELLEENGYYNIYEIDNYLDEGGRGGFQGTSYGSGYDGYRGYPGRLPQNMSPRKIKVKLYSHRITNPDDSVAWMDSALPITQKIDANKVFTANE